MNASSDGTLSVGQILRAAREGQGLSVHDVENRIKFATKQIEWLEADDYVRLHEAAFVRGFVRSYARLLKLDAADLLSNLPSSHLQMSLAHEVKSMEIPMPTSFAARKHNIIWLAAALVVALSLVIFERFHSRAPEQPQAQPVSNVIVQTLELPTGTAENVHAQMSAQTQDAVAVAQQIAKPEALVSVVPAPQQAAPKAVSTIPVPAVGDKPKVNAEINATEHALRLEFDKNSWLEIKDGNDKVLVNRIYAAGSLVRLSGKAPLLVVIGNPRAVRLFDNDKKIQLEQYTTAGVARVTLK